MKPNKINIIKTIKKETGLKIDLVKDDFGVYYWSGDIGYLLPEASTNYTSLTGENMTIELFVNDFKEKIKELEEEYQEDIETIINNINT